ncbi:tryptophan--tRNA ligase [Culicoidibacter larvae]|uniref:Tryptophan--tRNA ligase n=1 Tax=Culicoidibacter larvae TaxID=2579976 RepID=A0A5R8QGG0_9FIRM|nr:tryptophan--tRNA ligase [Culicoidibacter larvae]TLG77121.1 tryptophan--tRNA ligase [Culicoidibacter larvae]
MTTKKRVVSGIKPTGEMTLGNYIGAISNFVKMQDEFEMFVFVADLHALTTPQDPVRLRRLVREIVMVYLACGLDPAKTKLFLQSEIAEHSMLSWVLQCHTNMGELERMTQFKDKSAEQKAKSGAIGSGLFCYPVLMAADILLYNPDVVPVGEDQKQHVEITRDIAGRFNHQHGETFVIPEDYTPEVGARIMSLQDPTKKMSKSDENAKGYILLLDEPATIIKKIKSAVTDSEGIVAYDPVNKAGISNLLTIYSVLKNQSIDASVAEFADSNYGTFKQTVGECIVEALTPIQEKFRYYQENPELVDAILDEGAAAVQPIATKNMKKVYKKVGLNRK